LLALAETAPLDAVAKCGVVATAPVGEEVAFGEVADTLHEGHGVEVDVRATAQVGEVADEAVTGDVCRRARPDLDHELGGFAVEPGHHRDRFGLEVGWTETALDRGRDEAGAERFGEEQDVA